MIDKSFMLYDFFLYAVHKKGVVRTSVDCAGVLLNKMTANIMDAQSVIDDS